MPVTPGPEPAGNVPAVEGGSLQGRRQRSRWYSRFLGLCFVIFCFEIGVFLVVFPWLEFWQSNRLAYYFREWGDFWSSPFFRGALSGLGLVNIYISFLEILRLLKGTAHSDSAE